MRIYLDFNASTPVAPEVVEAMRPFLTDHFGNPSSQHWAGRPARQALEHARSQVADLLHSQPAEVVFTSGGSEADNHAIKGAWFARRDGRDHIVTTAIEHPAVLEPCRFLQRLGARLTVLPVDRTGLVDPEAVREAVTSQTLLITVMHANNEVGTVQPIAEIAAIARERGVLMHTDAAQTVGKIRTDVHELGVDLLTVAGHKLHAPKGVGALYIRDGVALEPLVHGAGHEEGRRAGTENVLLDVGLGAACELARAHLGMPYVRELRDYLWQRLRQAFGDRVVLNGHPRRRLPNTLNVSFLGQRGADLLAVLDDLAASTGAACHAGEVEVSPVLQALGLEPEVALGAVRFSLGRTTTRRDIDALLALLRPFARG
ncbi:MAG: cysteine desulfurase family protein [Planctomycetota bacterium]